MEDQHSHSHKQNWVLCSNCRNTRLAQFYCTLLFVWCRLDTTNGLRVWFSGHHHTEDSSHCFHIWCSIQDMKPRILNTNTAEGHFGGLQWQVLNIDTCFSTTARTADLSCYMLRLHDGNATTPPLDWHWQNLQQMRIRVASHRHIL